jgi:UDP-N-acetyl-D-galactosamine dehydrogenase
MDNKIKIAVIGLGYVGLPLALELSKYYNTTGFDIKKSRINSLKKNFDENYEFTNKFLKKFKNIKYTYNNDDLFENNYFIICLPTPLYKNNNPDLTAVKSSIKLIAKYLKINDMVILESTVYPGVSEDICIPILENYSNLKLITDINKRGFYFGYSPERVNPGDKKRSIKDIQKIVSSNSAIGLKKISKIYNQIITAGIHKIQNIKLAEASKIIENVQRDVNIALINEFTNIFQNEKFSIFDLLDASGTKWNFLKFNPGLVGGHCIGVDPYYLSYWAKKKKKKPRIILAGRETNDQMYKSIIKKIKYISSKKEIFLKKSKILLMGYTFKENCSDIRNTQIKKLLLHFSKITSKVNIFDPIANRRNLESSINKHFIKTPRKNFYDIIIICVNHKEFKKIGYNNIKKYTKKNSFIFDLKKCLNNKEIFYL